MFWNYLPLIILLLIQVSNVLNRSDSRGYLLQDLELEIDAIQTNSTELQSFFLGARTKGDIDVLEFWKVNTNTFPTLAMMARDIFAIPVSTVPSEACFSSANRILTDKRSRLGPIVFERLVCLKDWIDAENRMQYKIEAATSGTETQDTNTGTEADSDDDGDLQDNDLWYMNSENF